MKFKLSTCLLLLTLIAVLLAWRNDRNSIGSIEGIWKYPTPGMNMLGYSTTLEIRSDGTFTKEQRHKFSTETFRGTFSTDNYGMVLFHATERIGQVVASDPHDLVTSISQHYSCRCGIDRFGYLVVDGETATLHEFQDGIRWEFYYRSSGK